MKNYLENKYEEKFVVEESKIYNNGEKNTYHLAKAHPNKNENCSFTVKWNEEDIGTFKDNYLKYKCNKEGKKYIEKKLKEIYKEEINFYFNFDIVPDQYKNKMDIQSVIKEYPDNVTINFTYYVFCKNNIDKDKESKKIYKVIKDMFLDESLGEYSLSVYFINEKYRSDYENNKKYNLDLDTKELYKKKVIMNYLYMWDSNNIKNSNDIKELFKC
ncbi:hypothetical protein KQI30_14325 [Clostridium bornimense]|uniref:hypothetical protein n=3 Tax=Clostridium TaxID=1485 RepID=UPI001C11759F|nr:hypothetical protein [Clostridium bornimense]MBU5317430.1 hypothetical protein [Clostridium bornimense]